MWKCFFSSQVNIIVELFFFSTAAKLSKRRNCWYLKLVFRKKFSVKLPNENCPECPVKILIDWTNQSFFRVSHSCFGILVFSKDFQVVYLLLTVTKVYLAQSVLKFLQENFRDYLMTSIIKVNSFWLNHSRFC